LEHIMPRVLAIAPALLFAGILAGCTTPPESGNVYNAYQTMNEQSVRMGTVESVRNVTIANPDSGTGTVAGAALGGLGGSQVGHGNGSAAVGILGAVAGGIIGNRIENKANNRPGLEITVRLENGELRLLSNGYNTRVTH
jgi:outer membrane lipoprotein SlyB